MASEAYRGLLRILSNYGRLSATLLLGLVYVPIFLAWLGEDAFGLLTLMGTSVGIAAMATEMSRNAMLRELASKYHGDDEAQFLSVYNSAYVVSTGAGIVTAIGLAIVLLLLPLLKVSADFLVPARWLVVGHGSSMIAILLVQPATNMYRVKEWFLLDNIWLVARRAAHLFSGLILIYAFNVTEPSKGLIWFSILLGSILVSLSLLKAGLIMLIDRRLLPRPGRISRPALRAVAGDFGMQSFVTVAMNIHERAAQVIVYVVFGGLGTTIYGVSLRLSAYIRMLTFGVTGGLETVSARIGGSMRSGAMQDLLRHTTRLHAFVSIPAVLAIFILAPALLTLWIGKALTNPSSTIPIATTVVRILCFALLSRSLSDGWIVVLYGSGHLKQYAPLVIVGGLVNPLLTVLLLWVLPEGWKFKSPALAFALIMTVVHLGMLPAVAARCFQTTYREVVTPMLRPIIVTFALSPILIYGSNVAHQSILRLMGIVIAYGGAYIIASWFIVLTADERKRFSSAAFRRLQPHLLRSSISGN